jgi:hypothetical protein
VSPRPRQHVRATYAISHTGKRVRSIPDVAGGLARTILLSTDRSRRGGARCQMLLFQATRLIGAAAAVLNARHGHAPSKEGADSLMRAPFAPRDHVMTEVMFE